MCVCVCVHVCVYVCVCVCVCVGVCVCVCVCRVQVCKLQYEGIGHLQVNAIPRQSTASTKRIARSHTEKCF